MSSPAIADRHRHQPALTRGWAALAAALVVGASALLALAFSGDAYYGHIAILTFLAVVLAVTIRPLLLAGEASFCHGSFYALGAYTVGILAVDHGVSVWLGLPLGGVVAMLGAFLIGVPSLRTTGSYFFLMTFAFLVITNSLFQSLDGFTGGFSGISGIPAPEGVESLSGFFFLALALAVLTALLFFVFERSRWGLELRALGDARPLAQAAGASRLGNMMSAFALGAFFAGVAGGVYASYLTFIAPASFSIWLSVFVLTYVILGGARYFAGAIVGTLVLAVMPVAFNWSEAYIGIFTAAATLAILLLAPRGLVTQAVESFGALRRRRGADIDGAPPSRPVAGDSARAPASVPGRSAPDPAPAPAQAAPPTAASRPAPEGGPILRVDDLSQRFGGIQALDRVSFDVRVDEILGVIGPNGAGKTTLFNAISGFQRPTEGSVRFGDRELIGMAPHRIVRSGLTRTFQASSVCRTMTGFENVLLGARGTTGSFPRQAVVPVRGDRAATARADELIELFGLGEWRDTTAGDLPYGARKRLGVAIAMATDPKLLCLDEPMAGLSDAEVDDMAAALRVVHRERGVAVAIIEHRVPLVMSLCDRIVALDFGRVIATGTPAEVSADAAVIEAYLGTPEETGANA